MIDPFKITEQRTDTLPMLAVMALSPQHQLRWTARQWGRWATGRLVLL